MLPTERLFMMATGCSKMSTMRKQIVRQDALSKCPDLTLEETNRQSTCTDQARIVGYMDASKQSLTKEKLPIQTYIPQSKDSQVTLSRDKMNHDPKCRETQNQVQGLSPTKIPLVQKEQLLNRCNKNLEHFGKFLLRRRNKEKIYFHHGISLKKNESSQQNYKRVAGKRDFSDGMPVSSGVATETSSPKDNQDVLTDEQKATQKSNGHGLLDVHVSAELKKSPRRSSLDSSSGDEGFVNGDARKCASLSSALKDIPEDGACTVPTLKLNDHEKAISLTGQEKGEGFRKSKRSSGYGTGGSEEAPEDECFSSVFERSLSNSDAKPALETQLRLSYDPLSNTAGQLTEKELPDDIEEALLSPSTNGQRTVDLKESSLPNDACIWDLPCAQAVNIKPHIRRKYEDGVKSTLSPSEAGNDLEEIMRDNPQRPLPKLSFDDSVEGFYPVVEDVSEKIGELRSDDEHPSLSDVFEDCQLAMSDASVPTLADIWRRHDKQVNGYMDGFDAVDGARCLTQGAKTTSVLKQNTDNNITQRQKRFERAVFCRKHKQSCMDAVCLEGRTHICHVQDLIQRGKLQHCNPKIFEFLWCHSKKCTEFQCVVPLCDLFRQRPSLSLEEHKQLMTGGSLKQQFSYELRASMQNVLRNGTFLMLNDEGSDHALWKTAEVEYCNLMGDFCDFNILSVCLRFSKQSGASDKFEVVVKKALQSGQDEKNVYLAIKEPSPYVVQNYWCSELLDDTVLVCSVYCKDLMELQSLLYHDVTPDLCLAVLRQATHAAQYLHSLNVVYLSWKCSSMLYDQDNQSVKLCNFSHAMVLEQGVVVTSTDNVRSAIDPCFAAPEVLCGEAVGFYSDVWGLGCLLFEMLHKSKPYPDFNHQSPADIRRMVCRNEISHRYPEDQQVIYCNCWERVPAQRITIDVLLDLLADSTVVDR